MSASDSLFAGAALGVSLGSSAYAYKRLHQITLVINEMLEVTRIMSSNILKMDSRLQLVEQHDDSLKEYVDEVIDDIRTQLPSIEC